MILRRQYRDEPERRRNQLRGLFIKARTDTQYGKKLPRHRVRAITEEARQYLIDFGAIAGQRLTPGSAIALTARVAQALRSGDVERAAHLAQVPLPGRNPRHRNNGEDNTK